MQAHDYSALVCEHVFTLLMRCFMQLSYSDGSGSPLRKLRKCSWVSKSSVSMTALAMVAVTLALAAALQDGELQQVTERKATVHCS